MADDERAHPTRNDSRARRRRRDRLFAGVFVALMATALLVNGYFLVQIMHITARIEAISRQRR
jgi:hypothetical protein